MLIIFELMEDQLESSLKAKICHLNQVCDYIIALYKVKNNFILFFLFSF